MREPTEPVLSEDTAWASINTPLSLIELKIFCRDIERLFRINPMLEFNKWTDLRGNKYRMSATNNSQVLPFEIDTELHVEYQGDTTTIYYSNGLKKKTILKFEPSRYGSKLTIIDDYANVSEEERNNRLNEVDKSLTIWAEYLQRFFIMWQRWSNFGFWRWYMNRVWVPMKPSGRRITYILLWVSVAEIALIALGAAIYFVEYA